MKLHDYCELKSTHELIIRNLYGDDWREIQLPELNGVFGCLIVQSVIEKVPPYLKRIANYLNIDHTVLYPAFNKLSLNGVFLRNKIHRDKALLNGNLTAWGYYAGIALGATGQVG